MKRSGIPKSAAALTAVVLFLLLNIVITQVVPDEPPLWPVDENLPTLSADPVLPIHLQSRGHEFTFENRVISQYKITAGNDEPFQLLISSSGLHSSDRIYIRLSDSGGYLGPYQSSFFNGDNELLTDVIFENTIILELVQSAAENKNSELTLMEIIPFDNTALDTYQPSTSFIKPVPRSIFNREEPVLLLTGYWPPTNEMIRHFSQNPDLNPEGWQGEDWEGRGYDVVSYFPEFDPPNCSDCGQGYGDLEVDYQDTSEDFWNIVDQTQPMGVITFSRGFINHSWEMEWNLVNRTNWISDYTAPFQPTPNPPDDSVPAYYIRHSDLPLDEIISAIEGSGLGLDPYVDWNGNGGSYLSEFAGYHGVWYRAINQYTEMPCFTAGHIHVGGQIDWNTARQAAEVTIREVLSYLDSFIYTPGDVNQDEIINIQDLVIIVNFILGILEPEPIQVYAADINSDTIINVLDIIVILNMILAEG